MNKDLLKFIASLLLFGANGIVAAQISLPSHDIVVLRTLLGMLLLAALLLARRDRNRVRPSARSIALVSLSGMFLGISWLLLFEAYTLVGVGVSSVVYYCGPILVMALSPILFSERLTRVRVLGFGVVLAGVALVNGNVFGGDLDPRGVALSALAAVCMAAMIVFNKKAEGLDGLNNAFVQIAAACATAIVGTAALHGVSLNVQPGDWAPILLLGLVNTGLGCYLYFGTLGKLRTQTVAVCGYIEPIAAVVLSVLFLGEAMTATQVLGAVLVVAGAAGAECSGQLRRAAGLLVRPTHPTWLGILRRAK
ncbi:MAG TPA: EamA family transporter [Eggerthellaceae bacterium]|nr:EamA family transporter [Eggerthellaceae bacterium]